MKKIAVLFSGKGTNFAYIAEHLHHKDVEIAVALTNNPEAEGIAIAKAHGIPLEIIDPKMFESRELYDAAVVESLRRYAPELTVLAGFMRILTPVFTEQIRAINLHPSLLPRHKGLHAIEKSFGDNFDEGGVSVHWVTSELDGGEIIVQKRIPKAGHDLQSYTEAVKRIEKEALSEAIVQILKGDDEILQ